MRAVLSFINKYQALIIIAVLWQLFYFLKFFPEKLFPSLFTIFASLVELASSMELWESLFVTLQRILMGFILAAIVGIVIGILMSRSQLVDNIMQPIFTAGYPIPRVALYPIVVLIFGLGSTSKVIIIFLECLFPIVVNTYYGAQRVNQIHIWSGQNMGANSRQLFWKIFIPGTMPAIFTGFRIALPIAVVIAVLTEMISSNNGIGFLLTYLSASLAQSKVLAAIIAISIFGYILDRILLLIRNKFVYW